MPLTIEVHKLTRRFADFVALDQLNLSINSGEIFGLLGPNAAGKSTTIRILAGILRADEGTANILGLNLFTHTETIKHRIGYVAQQFALYPDLTVFENIEFYAALYGVNDKTHLHALLSLYGLTHFKDKRSGLLSGGYKRRLAIACATTHDPEVIFLDEPTAGIDPVTRKELWDLFYALSNSGKTLLITTHYMEEAERCNRLAFLNHGKLVTQGTPDEIRNSLIDLQVYSAEIPHNPELSRELIKLSDVQLVNQFGNELRIITKNNIAINQLENIIHRHFSKDVKISPVKPSIEDAFMSLTNNGDKQ